MREILKVIEDEKIIVVLRANSAEEAIEKAKAAYEGGLRILEVTFTVPNPEFVLKELRRSLSDVILGVGTVLDSYMCKTALNTGAEFVVSPHVDNNLSDICGDVLYIPGVLTPTEVVKALKAGRGVVKLFPGSLVGPSYIKALKGPFPNLKIIPTGGVNLENACDWLRMGCIAIGIGSGLIQGSFDDIKRRSRILIDKVRRCFREGYR